MNERIKELLDQAGYKPLPGFDFANSLEEQFMEKFALLIVKECADFLKDKLDDHFAAEQLEEHFEIEE